MAAKPNVNVSDGIESGFNVGQAGALALVFIPEGATVFLSRIGLTGALTFAHPFYGTVLVAKGDARGGLARYVGA